MLTIRVIVQGPVQRGQWRRRMERATAQGMENAERELLQAGHDDVRSTLNRVLRKQTPYYRTRIAIRDNRITDSGVIYGPWLEGVGSRNKTTRFKGYFTFRKVTSRLQQKKGYVTDRAIRKALRAAGV